MLKRIFAGVVLPLLSINLMAEPLVVKGKIIPSDSKITILKIWGTHQERGFAYGYLLGKNISETFAVYSKTISKCKYRKMRFMLKNGNTFTIDKSIVEEAKWMIEGMNKAQTNPNNLDYLDLLLENTLFDMTGIKCLSDVKSFACSSLMNWGSSTLGTDLNGESVISRHFDWYNPAIILQNQVIIIHIPAEPEEQPWLGIGIAGQMGVISGINQSGVSAFLHTAPFTGMKGRSSNMYEPVMLALRKGIERKDFNNDKQSDVFDIWAALSDHKTGFARPCIVSALTSAKNKTNERIAMVAELIPLPPYIAVRTNEYADAIPGDNLYTANSLLKIKNRALHGTRNKDMISAIGDGKAIGTEKNWELMRDHSRFKVPFNIETNIQFMQYIPGSSVLNLSVSTDKTPAFSHKPVRFDLNAFFIREK